VAGNQIQRQAGVTLSAILSPRLQWRGNSTLPIGQLGGYLGVGANRSPLLGCHLRHPFLERVHSVPSSTSSKMSKRKSFADILPMPFGNCTRGHVSHGVGP
jgi:hypothetical protein